MNYYLGSVALEKNRWSTREPSLAVSEFMERAISDGFYGIELWENHYFKSSKEEQTYLKNVKIPWIFNSYAAFDSGMTEELRVLLNTIEELKVGGIKFNLSNDQSKIPEMIQTVNEFAALLPGGVQMLCECHPGTVMDDPETANEILKQLDVRCNAIVHLAPEINQNALCFQLYGERIRQLHTQVRRPDGEERTMLREQALLVTEKINELKVLGFHGDITIEFTQDGTTVWDTYHNAYDDFQFLKEIGL